MTNQAPRSGVGRGMIYGFSAYALWGLAPLYWQLLRPASATEILASRMTWSLVFLAILNQVRRTWPAIVAVLRNRRSLRLLTIAALLITLNWGLYIWSVVNDHVIDASLGYFINPLVNVALGVFLLKEKLRKVQWTAVAIAACGVLWLTVDAGKIPWIGVILGLTFGSYGMVKKIANVDAVESLTVETILLLPFSTVYIIWLELQGTATFGHAGWLQGFWTLMAGVITALPLLAFGAATVRVPYSTLGILQYISPTLQFIIGFTVLHEHMTRGSWYGFGIVWIALAVFSVDAIRSGKRFAASDE